LVTAEGGKSLKVKKGEKGKKGRAHSRQAV
jgi:hypothetical protein